MNIIAFDPGQTTGFAHLWRDTHGTLDSILIWDQFDFNALAKYDWDELSDDTIEADSTVLLYEQPYGQQQFVKNIVYEAVGAIKALSAHYNLELVGQRADVPKFVKARFFDGNEPRLAIHAREALCHIIFRIHTLKLLPQSELERIIKACQEFTSPTGQRSNAVDVSGTIRILRN